jgi:hypothetical protein
MTIFGGMETFSRTKVDEALMEMYSSAFTMSDMEIFVFPQLMFALVLANIMSPVIWGWRDEGWFKGIEKMSYTQRINRVKQFIIDRFVFNLDLETWGLTKKEVEIERFLPFLDEETIAKSNALFGYEGDKHYFDIDIRKHFGLDKYVTNVIPYWKTETVEAMEAFRHKPSYTTGAGECVSLSTLYAAVLFIVARVPLEKIFLMATPLHSQNFIDVKDGVLTNNRRIVTKTMWTNGTSMSTKARRALENEEVTIVAHQSGYIHTVYRRATIDRTQYEDFTRKLKGFLKAELKPEMISNFLRKENRFQCCFQYRHVLNGREMYIEVERIYQYEHTSPNSFSTDSRNALLKEIELEEFSMVPIPERIFINDLEDLVRTRKDLTARDLRKVAERELQIQNCLRTEEMFGGLERFLVVEPRLPSTEKEYDTSEGLDIPLEASREDVARYIRGMAESNRTAELALYAYRDMDRIDWAPFVKAAVERNPVSLEALKDRTLDEAAATLDSFESVSIYGENRLALPDEVWNFGRADGIEKALFLLNLVKNRHPGEEAVVRIRGGVGKVEFESKHLKKSFESKKNLDKTIAV